MKATQTDMAVYLDMNRGHISDIERGKPEAGVITLRVISKGLDTTMANLLEGWDRPHFVTELLSTTTISSLPYSHEGRRNLLGQHFVVPERSLGC